MNIEDFPLIPKPPTVPAWITEARSGIAEDGRKINILILRLPDGKSFHCDCAGKWAIEPMVNNLGMVLFEYEYPNQLSEYKGRPSLFIRMARNARDGIECPEDEALWARMRELSYTRKGKGASGQPN